MEMITVRSVKPTFSRQPDEQAKFNYLIHLLVRVKGKTGLPSGKIVSALLTRGKDEVNWNRAKNS